MKVKDKALEGLSYNVLLKLLTIILQTVTSIAIAHYLSSTEYGVVAFALVYINFLTQFGDIGLTSAAVQREHLSDDSLHTAFTIKLVLGLLLGLIGVGIALALAAGGGRPVAGVLAILSANFLISSLGFIPQTRLTRALDYRKLAIVQFIATLASTVVTVLLLVASFSYWAVALGYTGASVASVVAFTLLLPAKPRLLMDLKAGMSFMTFGSVLFMTGLLNFAILNADNFLIGWQAGQSALGKYALSFNWSFVATTQVLGILVSVLFPLYSKIQNDREQLRRLYLRSLEYTAALVMLLNMELFCFAPQFLYLILGGGTDKWMSALSAFRILCVDGVVAGLLVPIAPLTVAMGKPGVMLKAVALAAAIELVALVPALKLAGIGGVAVAVTIAGISQYIVYVSALRRELQLEWKALLKAVGPAMAGGAVLLALWGGLFAGRTVAAGWATLVGGGISFAICFAAIYGACTKWALYREMAVIYRERVGLG